LRLGGLQSSPPYGPTFVSDSAASFLGPRHVLAQHRVDVRLPAWAFLPVGIQHVGVQAQGLVDLALGLGRAATALADRLGGLRAKYAGDRIDGSPRRADFVARPFGVVFVQAGSRAIVTCSYHSTSLRLALRKLMAWTAS
jgi:hypothetical protein